MIDTNQHYITRAYLDKFIHPEAGQAVLFPYRRGRGACKAKGTRRLGSAINFYRQRENESLHDNLDEARKRSESLLFSSGKRTPSTFAACVYDDGFIPDEHDALQLAAAAAFLWCGSPVQLHNTAMHALAFHQMWFFNILNTDEAMNVYRESHGEAAAERLEEDRRQVFEGDLFVDVGEENWKQLGFMAFEIEAELIRLLLGMRMTVVNCHPRCFFLTSDNPVVRTFPSGAGKLDDELWFPISHKRGVLWHRRTLGVRTTFGYSETFAYNRRLIKNSYRFVFSPLPQDWIAAASREVPADPPLLGHYGSLREMIEEAKPAVDLNGRSCGEIVDIMAALRARPKPDVVGI